MGAKGRMERTFNSNHAEVKEGKARSVTNVMRPKIQNAYIYVKMPFGGSLL